MVRRETRIHKGRVMGDAGCSAELQVFVVSFTVKQGYNEIGLGSSSREDTTDLIPNRSNLMGELVALSVKHDGYIVVRRCVFVKIVAESVSIEVVEGFNSHGECDFRDCERPRSEKEGEKGDPSSSKSHHGSSCWFVMCVVWGVESIHVESRLTSPHPRSDL